MARAIHKLKFRQVQTLKKVGHSTGRNSGWGSSSCWGRENPDSAFGIALVLDRIEKKFVTWKLG
jgi:hypothetical protein